MPRQQSKEKKTDEQSTENLHPEIKKGVWVVIFLGLAILLILASLNEAGPWGNKFYKIFDKLFGWGYYLLPVTAFILAFSFIAPEKKKFWGATLIASILFILSGLGLIDIILPGKGGLTGSIIGALKAPFGIPASIVITLTALLASFLVILNKPLRLRLPKIKKDNQMAAEPLIQMAAAPPTAETQEKEIEKKEPKTTGDSKKNSKTETAIKLDTSSQKKLLKDYTAPPLSLLASSIEKPTIGDLRANANIIKRTLESFGISVEMGEINVGPAVTRYTLKPAEGIKLSRIEALHKDLALALAAHPIRIEAPIPGKSLVGIEVPNKNAALVRLGSLLLYPEFQKSGLLAFALGRNVSGEPVFADIAKMPHLLIAGATGSGKSITIHSLIVSLLYKNSPTMLRLILIDPKRVELSAYDNIPHLMAPVITDNKQAIGALRWAIQEMERRYELLLSEGARDIKSYNKNKYRLPYLLIVIDELADLMAAFGREVEGAIIRLAQMSRATGIHLVVSTQRPSVEVITGLIKANITSRIALQVASQVDSRTILDTAGAEKLLGAGDSLFISAELSKPMRLQGAYLTEEEIKKVTSFIRENNAETEMTAVTETNQTPPTALDLESLVQDENDDDELLEKAIEVIRSAKKASASLLQRRLKIGYARAARLLDMMEEKGIVGPGEGAKPRDVYL
jgi:S-DNA-T family DNA segregation ATPase FtsK/SpoIIIE